MSRANAFLDTFKVRVDKIPSENEVVFLTRIGHCLSHAKTDKARWRLYQAALLRINYSWMQYIDKTFME